MPRRSILLAAAFAGLLLVIGASSFAIWLNTRQAQDRVANLHNTHMEAGAALATVRANVYLAAILTRDFLLDSEPSGSESYTSQFAHIRESTEDNFRVLLASAQDAGQTAALSELHQQLERYWDSTQLILNWTPEEKRAQRTDVLRQRLHRREEILAISQQVENLITKNFLSERARITTADQEFRASLGWTTGIALLLGFCIGGVAFTRLLRLELQSQRAESALRLLSGQIRTAQEEERKYLSRELHDQVGQMLTGLRMELAGMAKIDGDPTSELSARIVRAKATVEQTLNIVRNIAMLLRPSMLDDLGLTPALVWLVKEVSRSSGIEIEVDIDPATDLLPDAYRTCLYRVVQEALTNLARHSEARKATLMLKIGNGEVLGSITDNGQGFDAAVMQRRGLGLLGMEERVRELGGTILVSSGRGIGTKVEIRLPHVTHSEVTDDSSPDRGRSRDCSDRVKTPA
ncbi:MAG: sensor histidine kinase [Bryobacteraceae bacterium]|jgi:signal transduction histidine kinase